VPKPCSEATCQAHPAVVCRAMALPRSQPGLDRTRQVPPFLDARCGAPVSAEQALALGLVITPAAGIEAILAPALRRMEHHCAVVLGATGSWSFRPSRMGPAGRQDRQGQP